MTLGEGPSVLHPNDPDARAMKEDGYWPTDFHALFTDGTVFRDGSWKELATRVKTIGSLRVKPGWGFFLHTEDLDEDKQIGFERLPPGGDAEASVAESDGKLLAILLRSGGAPIAGWTPALHPHQRVPRAPYLPMIPTRWPQRMFLSAGGIFSAKTFPAELKMDAVRLDERVIAIAFDDVDLMAWWGLDESGAIGAFVLDASGAVLREFDQVDPTPDDPRFIKNSCPRIVKDERSLVRRIERLVAEEQIVLAPGADATSIARAFFAQPKGNLRKWLLEAPDVEEVFYPD